MELARIEEWAPDAEVGRVAVDPAAGAVEITFRLAAAGEQVALTLTGVDKLWLEGFPSSRMTVAAALALAEGDKASGGRAEDRDFALELLGLEDEKAPLSGGRRLLHLEPGEDGDLHLAVRFSGLTAQVAPL